MSQAPLETTPLDAALAAVDQAERRMHWLIAVAALLEAGLLIAFLKVMDFANTTHWLILIAAVLVYATLGLGLFALGVYAHHNTRRVLDAIDLSRSPDSNRAPGA